MLHIARHTAPTLIQHSIMMFRCGTDVFWIQAAHIIPQQFPAFFFPHKIDDRFYNIEIFILSIETWIKGLIVDCEPKGPLV